MSQVEVDKIIPQSGTTLTIGDNGDTITIASGATLSGDLNADNLTSGTVPDARITGTYTGITGLDLTDGSKIRLGTGNDLEIFHNGANSFVKDVGSGALILDTNGTDVRITKSDAEFMAKFVTDDAVELYYDNSKKFETTSDGIAVTGGKIRTNSSTSTLSIQGGSTYPGAKIQMAGGQASSNPGTMIFLTDDGNVANPSERARIDASGTLLIGKTDTTATNTGLELEGTGTIVSRRNGNVCLFLDRKTSDGTILEFRKDNSTVGTIGIVNSNNLYIQGDSTNSGLQCGTNTILPVQSGANASNTIDMGDASNLWKDLYLGGGLYVGGTGTANKLDDYEEGTWTPSLSISSSGASGYYTVVGNIVHAYFKITTTTTGNNITINNFPFATKGSTPDVIGGARETQTSGRFYQITASASNTSAYIFRYDNSNSISSGMIFQGSLIYQKA